MKTIIDLPGLYDRLSHSLECGGNLFPDVCVFRIEDLQESEGLSDIHSRRTYFKVSLVSGESPVHYLS